MSNCYVQSGLFYKALMFPKNFFVGKPGFELRLMGSDVFLIDRNVIIFLKRAVLLAFLNQRVGGEAQTNFQQFRTTGSHILLPSFEIS